MTIQDIAPAWSPDGKGLYFSSARGGSFAIYYVNLDSGAVSQVPGLRGVQLQPAPSPDGKLLAYIAPVQGRLGSGGIWVKPLPDGEPRVVYYEETSFHAKPKWSPDSSAIVFTSEEAGTADIAAIPVQGGSAARLTADGADEFSPVYSPDGSRIAFFSNYDGPAHLMTMPAGGARRQGWTEVRIRERRSSVMTGRVRVRVLGPDGKPMPSRVTVMAADGRSYAPDGGFHRVNPVIDTHYFPTSGQFDVEVPAGRTKLFAMRGPEYQPASTEVEVAGGKTINVEMRLQRLIDAPGMGWYSGDTHTHDLHDGRFGLTHEQYFEMLLAEDLDVTNDLIHMDGTHWMGRPSDLTGEPHPLSTSTHILQYAEEFRGSMGHIGLLGIHEFAMPPVGGIPNTVYANYQPNYSYVDAAHAQGGLAGFMHPYTRRVVQPQDGANSEIALDVALGKGDFYDVTNIPYDDLINAEMYYRYLNAGFRLPATGGSDDFGNSWNGEPPGTSRTYAHVEGRLSVRAWLDAIKAGRTFGTTGPLLFFSMDGKDPGSEIRTSGPVDLRVRCDVATVAPLDRIEWIVNGEVAKVLPVSGRERRYTLSDTLHLENSAWVAARAIGPSSPTVSDDYAFVQSTPVYIVRDGKPFISAKDAQFLDAMVAAMWQRLEAQGHFESSEAREKFRAAVDRARRVYQDLARSGLSYAK